MLFSVHHVAERLMNDLHFIEYSDGMVQRFVHHHCARQDLPCIWDTMACRARQLYAQEMA